MLPVDRAEHRARVRPRSPRRRRRPAAGPAGTDASRMLPSAASREQRQGRRLVARCSRPAGSASGARQSTAPDRRFRLNCRQRDSTVTGSFCGSVVASRNFTCGGGSSSVLSSALKEWLRQHVHFVDQVDLEAAARRRVLHVVEQVARVVDLGARGGIDLDQVDDSARRRCRGRWRRRRRVRADAAFAVQALGEDARDGGLADAARAREQERVVHALPLSSALPSARRTCSWPDISAKLRDAICAPARYSSCVGHSWCATARASKEATRTSRIFGARPNRYRCSLPGLTGFTAGRREGANAGHHRSTSGGEGGIRTHEYPLGYYWNSSPAPSTTRPPLRAISRRRAARVPEAAGTSN